MEELEKRVEALEKEVRDIKEFINDHEKILGVINKGRDNNKPIGEY